MPFTANNHEHLVGMAGHCVPMVREATGLPPTAHWRRGARVQDVPDLPYGAAVATFHGDHYGNRTDGSSHAALFLHHEERGAIRVFDTWVGRNGGAQERTIREKHGAGPAVDDAGRFYVVEVA
jgi:hypothetical protein